MVSSHISLWNFLHTIRVQCSTQSFRQVTNTAPNGQLWEKPIHGTLAILWHLSVRLQITLQISTAAPSCLYCHSASHLHPLQSVLTLCQRNIGISLQVLKTNFQLANNFSMPWRYRAKTNDHYRFIRTVGDKLWHVRSVLCALVSRQMIMAVECSVADTALVWPFAGVYSHVSSQIMLQSKWFMTPAALVSTFASVNELMPFEINVTFERFITWAAFEGSFASVHSQMCSQMGLVNECLVAQVALEWSISCVHALMGFEIFMVEQFLANIAFDFPIGLHCDLSIDLTCLFIVLVWFIVHSLIARYSNMVGHARSHWNAAVWNWWRCLKSPFCDSQCSVAFFRSPVHLRGPKGICSQVKHPVKEAGSPVLGQALDVWTVARFVLVGSSSVALSRLNIKQATGVAFHWTKSMPCTSYQADGVIGWGSSFNASCTIEGGLASKRDILDPQICDTCWSQGTA